MNEKGVRHWAQKPSVRPGLPSRDLPTGAPHFGQNRRSSGTIGFTRMAWLGSSAGTEGIVVSPAPSRAPRSRVLDVPTLRVVREPPVRTEPSGVLASNPDDDVSFERVDAAPAATAPASGPTGVVELGLPWTGTLVTAPAGVPQTSQYPSSMTPVHPGTEQRWVPRARPAASAVIGPLGS